MTEGKTTHPDAAELDIKRLQRLDRTMQAHIEQQNLAGLVVLIARGGVVGHIGCYGFSDTDRRTPMGPETIFKIASMTKPIVSVAAMMLYEQGYFQLDDSVSKFIPEFGQTQVYVAGSRQEIKSTAQQRPMTIKDLLTHTSGLVYWFIGDSPVHELNKELKPYGSEHESLDDMVKKLADLPLAFQPGSAWQYGVSTDVLARVIEVITGERIDDFLQHTVLEPLGMSDTAYCVPVDKLQRVAHRHSIDESGNLIGTPITDKITMRPRIALGGGGLCSTAVDYFRFCQMLLNGGKLEGTRLLSRKTVELMTMNHLPDMLLPIGFKGYLDYPLDGYGFGLGFRVLLDVALANIVGSRGEYGWTGIRNTYFWIDPVEELIGIVLTQFAPLTGRIEREVKTLTYQALE